MRGMQKENGQSISGIEYLIQRFADVITTPKATRVMNRDYGCDLFKRIDGHMDQAWLVQCYADIAEAARNPINGLQDFLLESIKPKSMTESGLVFEIRGVYQPTGERTTLDVSVLP